MDSVKMGAFLKALRKEKGWTQQQLAEQLYTTNRTISRWENGVNLPDLEILLTLSDLYQVPVGDLLAGQRTQEPSAPMDTQVLPELSDYSQKRESQISRRFFIIGISGAIAAVMTICLGFKWSTYANSGWLAVGFVFAVWFLFTIKSSIDKHSHKKISSKVYLWGIASTMVSNVLLWLIFFPSGEYHNYGILGGYCAAAVPLVTFCLARLLQRISTKYF